MAALALALVGCGDLLDLKDLQPYPDQDAGGSDAAASLDADESGSGGDSGASSADGSASDAHVDQGGRGADGSGSGDASASDAIEESSPPGDAPITSPETSTSDASSSDASSHDAAGSDAPCTGSPTDAHNCGTCGHDCLGGTCSGGACQPFVLSTSVTAYDMVAVGGSLYWVDQGTSVWTCTIASCSPHTIATGQSTPERIAYGGNGVLYWTNYGSGSAADGSVESYQISGGTKTPLATGIWTPQGIGADGTYVFWSESYAPTAQIVRYAIASTTTTGYPTGTSSAPTGVAVGNGSVYWTDEGSGNVEGSPEGTLAQSPVGTGQSTPIAVSTDGTYVYWADFVASGAVWQYTIAGGALHQLSGTEAYPIRVAGDAAQVYWIAQGASTMDGKLVGCSPSNCSPSLIAGSLARPSSLAMDASGVYFGTVGDQKLYMMVR